MAARRAGGLATRFAGAAALLTVPGAQLVVPVLVESLIAGQQVRLEKWQVSERPDISMFNFP